MRITACSEVEAAETVTEAGAEDAEAADEIIPEIRKKSKIDNPGP